MSNNRRRLTGRVIKNGMDKTVVVSVESTKRHRLYGKTIRSEKSFFAHDESDAIEIGATVQIVESRPISKRKRWVVEEIISDSTARGTSATLIEQLDDEAPPEALATPEAPGVESAVIKEAVDEAEEVVAEVAEEETAATIISDATQEIRAEVDAAEADVEVEVAEVAEDVVAETDAVAKVVEDVAVEVEAEVEAAEVEVAEDVETDAVAEVADPDEEE